MTAVGVDPVAWARALGVASMPELVDELHTVSAAVAEAVQSVHDVTHLVVSLPESEVSDHLAAGLRALEDAASALSSIQGVLGGWS